MNAATGAPEFFGTYRLLEKLGQGGMAVVYRAERSGDAGFRKKVAIKRMLPQFRRDPSLLERFAAEARTNARLDHPNLVQVIDFGIEPEPHLVLEFVEGVSLGALMQRLAERVEKLDVAAACFIAAEIATGLDHAHRKKGDDGTPLGIVHRDVSPQNVLISNEGSVKVSDFGLVKAADNVLRTQTGVTIGKMSYMAPEQADGKDIDARADVFALGVTLWEMLTIRTLIPPEDPAVAAKLLQSGDFAPPSTWNPEVSPRLDALVLACLAIDRERRTPSAQQVAQDLREFLHQHAAGYGKPQLARFLQWIFPERGWELPEPERPAAQPSADERASIVQVTPATVAIARAEGTLPPPADTGEASLSAGPATITGRHPSIAPAPQITGHHPAVITAGHPAVATVPARRATISALLIGALLGASAVLVLLLVIGGALFWMYGRTNGSIPTVPAVNPSQNGNSVITSVQLASNTPDTRFYLGASPLPPRPVLTPDEVTGEPLVVIAPQHDPLVIRTERLLELTRLPPHVHTITLEPTNRPDIMVYVRGGLSGTVHLPDGETIGVAPGVVRVPTRRDVRTPTEIDVVDEATQARSRLSLEGCDPDRVCMLYARQ